ncbi:hypothetical protein TWF730_010241 [Orbilia blumenaviensis]|uniref:Uncharacterized protein n=1 Tax=Orbilia blumenaviensis TaxID=1796055 RepID=A0AAV9UP84_9PEZI
MSFGFGTIPLGPSQGPAPAPAMFQSGTAPGYTPNVEFQLNPIDPGLGAANRDKILAEQQRILTIFNDWFIAQKLKLLGQGNSKLPQIANEEANRDQMQGIIRDFAEMNINRMAMAGLVNNFGEQYCKFVSQRDAVETQRQLNEIERARIQGYDYLPPPAQRFVRVCQIAVILSVGGTFATLVAIWSGATAVRTSLQAAKTAGLQCLVMGLLQFICLIIRAIVRIEVGKFMIPITAYGRDRIYLTKMWDGYIVTVFCAIIAFGAWMWTKSNANFKNEGLVAQVPAAITAAAATVLPAATARIAKVKGAQLVATVVEDIVSGSVTATSLVEKAVGALVTGNPLNATTV